MKIYLSENDLDGIFLDIQKLCIIKYLRMNTTISTRGAIEMYLNELCADEKIVDYDIDYIIERYYFTIEDEIDKFFEDERKWTNEKMVKTKLYINYIIYCNNFRNYIIKL